MTSMARKSAGHRFYSRRAVLLGTAIGLAFIAAMFAASMLPQDQHIVAARVLPLPALDTGAAACGTEMDEHSVKSDGQIRLLPGNGRQHFLVSAPSDLSDGVLIIRSMVDQAELYRCVGTDLIDTGMRVGDTLPFSERPLALHRLAFPLGPIAPDDRLLIVITQNSFISTHIELNEYRSFLSGAQRELTLALFLFGAISALVVYNLVLSLVAANATFMFNALTVFSMLALDIYMTGIGPAYLWPAQPWLSNWVIGLSLAGPTLFAPFYVYHFLEDRPLAAFFSIPIYWLWPAASVVGLAAMPFVPLWPVYIFHTATWIVMTIFFAGLLLRRVAAGDERATILLVPLFGAIVPVMLVAIFKEFVGFDFGWVGRHATELALLLEAMLFTLALAYLLRLSQWRESAALDRANQVAQSVNRRLVETLDDERERVAGELHDTAGQNTVLISNWLGRLSASPRLDRALRSEVGRIEQLAGKMLAEIRDISHSLHPAVLDHLGFERAAKTLAENLGKANGQRIVVDLPDTPMSLTKNQALQLYRIVQGLLSNALKHAPGSPVRLAIAAHDPHMVLSVADNGPGIPDGPEPAHSGIGMRILMQRAASLPGDMTVQSGSDGTTVSVRFVPGASHQTRREDAP